MVQFYHLLLLHIHSFWTHTMFMCVFKRLPLLLPWIVRQYYCLSFCIHFVSLLKLKYTLMSCMYRIAFFRFCFYFSVLHLVLFYYRLFQIQFLFVWNIFAIMWLSKWRKCHWKAIDVHMNACFGCIHTYIFIYKYNIKSTHPKQMKSKNKNKIFQKCSPFLWGSFISYARIQIDTRHWSFWHFVFMSSLFFFFGFIARFCFLTYRLLPIWLLCVYHKIYIYIANILPGPE